jgi:hypothetical protein
VEWRHWSPAMRDERSSGSVTSRSLFRDNRTNNELTGGDRGMVNCSPSWGKLKIYLARLVLVEVVLPVRRGNGGAHQFVVSVGEGAWRNGLPAMSSLGRSNGGAELFAGGQKNGGMRGVGSLYTGSSG